MSGQAPLVGSRRKVALTRTVLGMFLLIGVLGAGLSLLLGALKVILALADGTTTVSLIADKPLPAGAVSAGMKLVDGSYAAASVTVAHLSAEAVAFATTSAIADTLTRTGLCMLIALLAWRLLRGMSFRRSLSLVVTLGGSVLVVGGLLAQISASIASGLTAVQLNGSTGPGFWPLEATLDPTLPVFGVVLLLVGLAFEYGERLQTETDGLV